MKRILMSLATAVGLSVCGGSTLADPGGFVPPSGGQGGVGFPDLGQMTGPNTLFSAGTTPKGRAPDRYGLHPCIKKLFHIPVANAGGMGSPYGTNGNPVSNPNNWPAAGYGMGGPGYNPQGFPPPGAGYGPAGPPPGAGYGPAGPYGPGGCGPAAGPNCMGGYPPMMQGTLVFPYNNLTRSPRDFFMVDMNK